MKTFPFFLAAVLTAALLPSCLPRERMVWSPDGMVAVVATREGLVFADAAGRNLGPIETDAGICTQLDGTFAWGRDGKTLFLVTEKTGLAWKDAARLVPEGEAARVEALANSLPHLIRAGRESLPPGPTKFEDIIMSQSLANEPLLLVALRAAFEADPEPTKNLFANLVDEKEIIDALQGEQLAISVYQLRWKSMVVGSARFVEGPNPILLASLFPIGQLAPSPDTKRLAFARKVGESSSIEHMATTPSPNNVPVVVYPNPGVCSFTWSEDGSRLFVARLLDKEMPLGRIESISVTTDGVKREPSVLAEGMMADPPSLALLPDGSILFPASPVTYPLAGSAARPAPAFHRVQSDGSAIARVPTPEGALSADLRFFSVSPDGGHVAMVESGSTTVATLDLKSGEVKLVASPSAGWKCLTRPAWRNNAEFTYAAEKDGKPTVMLHSLVSGSKPWGESFPDGAFSAWLEPPEEK